MRAIEAKRNLTSNKAAIASPRMIWATLVGIANNTERSSEKTEIAFQHVDKIIKTAPRDKIRVNAVNGGPLAVEPLWAQPMNGLPKVLLLSDVATR